MLEPAENNATDDAGERIRFDLPCVACDYNLRTQRYASCCPECGTAVEASLHRRLLRFASRAWVARIQSGANCLLGGIALLIGTLVLAMASAVTGGARLLVAHIVGLMFFAAVGVVVLLLAGVLDLTVLEPNGPGPARRWSIRAAARTLVSLSVLMWVSLLLFESLLIDHKYSVEALDIGAVAIGMTAVFSVGVLVIGWGLFVAHLRRLARRGTSRRLPRIMTALLWATGIPILCVVVWALFLWAVYRSSYVAMPATGITNTTTGPAGVAIVASGSATPLRTVTGSLTWAIMMGAACLFPWYCLGYIVLTLVAVIGLRRMVTEELKGASARAGAGGEVNC